MSGARNTSLTLTFLHVNTMKILAVISQKGGAGKTTLATALAVAAQQDGREVALLDLDPQASACFWGDRRKANNGGIEAPPVRDVNWNRLRFALEQIGGAGKATGLIVIDCPPQQRDIAAEAIRFADMVLIPTRPEVIDLHATAETIRTVQQQGKAAHVVLSACPISGPEIEETEKWITGSMNAELVPVRVHQRKAYSRAMAAGLTAQEFEPDGKAAAEIKQLYMFTCRHLFGVQKNGKAKQAVPRRA